MPNNKPMSLLVIVSSLCSLFAGSPPNQYVPNLRAYNSQMIAQGRIGGIAREILVE